MYSDKDYILAKQLKDELYNHLVMKKLISEMTVNDIVSYLLLKIAQLENRIEEIESKNINQEI